MQLQPGSLVADIACGAGTTLRLLRARGHRAVGVDLTPTQVVGDAQQLPLRSGAFDAVLVECSVSTFDWPADALAEALRVLRPGGVLGMTDVLLDGAPPDVTRAVARLTNARTAAAYALMLETAGFTVTGQEDRNADALALVRRLRRRLPLSRTLRACEGAVRSGTLSYGLLVAYVPKQRP